MTKMNTKDTTMTGPINEASSGITYAVGALALIQGMDGQDWLVVLSVMLVAVRLVVELPRLVRAVQKLRELWQQK